MLKTLCLLLALGVAAAAAVRIEKVDYKGWPDSYRISNGEVELVVVGDIGPRIMRYAFVGGQNLFKEFEEQLGKSGETTYQLRGGARLWVSPETLATSWALDNVPVKVSIRGDALEATEPVEPTTGVQKQIIVRMSPSGTNVEVVHRIYNHTPWAIELAPWAMSMMAPGGTAITKFPPRGKHPQDLAPTNPLVMWAYTNLSDKRFGFYQKYLTLKQDVNNAVAEKIGLFNKDTWAAYLLGTDLFVKQASADPSSTYPDFGCSFETFTDNTFLEMETLGPLQKVAPGGYAEHIERWSLHKDVRMPVWNEQSLDELMGRLAK